MAPYGIGWNTILNEKAIEYFTSREIRLVIIAESPLISISNPLVHTERLLPYNRSKFEIILGILRNFVFVDTSKKHAETLELKIKIYEQHNTMVRWMRKLFGKRLSKSKCVKSCLFGSATTCSAIRSTEIWGMWLVLKTDYM